MALEVWFPEDVGRILAAHHKADQAYRDRLGSDITPEMRAFLDGRENQRVVLATALGLPLGTGGEG